MSTPSASTQYLIIDDNKIDQLVTGKLLRTKLEATNIMVFNNGKEALTWIQKDSDTDLPMIIFLDIKMPTMNGFEFMDNFNLMDETIKKHTRVFMLSSSLNPEDIERAIRYEHVDTILEKPLSVDQLGNLIDDLVPRKL